MHRTTPIALATLLAAATLPVAAAPRSTDSAYKEERAVIVVTGMRVDEDPAHFQKDLSVAEGATVQVTTKEKQSRTRKTERFARAGKAPAEASFTADFEVAFEVTYSIAMTFKDGTVVRIDDYRLPRDWKTHFYFHSTNGTLSPASVLRTAEDPRTKLRMCIYAVYPLESYRKLGGNQIR